MTLELVPVEEFRVHDPFREPDLNGQRHDAGDHSALQADDQCRFCLKGPLVEAQFRYTDARRDAFERLLQRLWTKKYPGRRQAERYYRDQYRRKCRLCTIRSSFVAIESFLLYIAKNGKTHLEQITREDIYGFIEQEQDRGMKPLTVHTRLRSIKAFLRVLIADELVDHRVLLRRISIKIPETLPRAIDPEDVKLLLSVIKDVRNRAMILVLLRTGMRIGELLNTKVRDVNLKERRIDIFEARKNRTGRVVYLSDDALKALKTWFKQIGPGQEYVLSGFGGKKFTYQGARIIFVKYLQQAGLADKGYTLHCLRHTFASELLNAGMRLECLQQLLGHSSVEMTRRYARLTDKTREEEYFRAMAIIERGEIDGHYRCDHKLQAISKEKELLGAHGEELPVQP